IKFIPLLIRPIFLYMLRKKYIHVGFSQHKKTHEKMMKSLEEKFRKEGDKKTKFYLSFLEDEPRPDAAVITALNEGASRIIVSEIFLTISNHTAEGKELVRKINFDDYGVSIAFTGPLWDSKTLQGMFIERVKKNLGKADKKKVGVLLVGHGQPKEWDIEWPTETEQEIKFRTDVLELFVKDGYDRKNLDLAWMEFREPCTSEAVQKLVQNGVEKIFYFSAAISADSIHSMCDLPELVSKCEVPNCIDVINLGAWNDDPIVIDAIKEKIDRVRFG
ncbi:MAG: ferrochelatase, partial [Candidatus Methanofastidiosum sp.]|nr:ferrochelatase [Methanofastidiosum sp.]